MRPGPRPGPFSVPPGSSAPLVRIFSPRSIRTRRAPARPASETPALGAPEALTRHRPPPARPAPAPRRKRRVSKPPKMSAAQRQRLPHRDEGTRDNHPAVFREAAHRGGPGAFHRRGRMDAEPPRPGEPEEGPPEPHRFGARVGQADQSNGVAAAQVRQNSFLATLLPLHAQKNGQRTLREFLAQIREQRAQGLFVMGYIQQNGTTPLEPPWERCAAKASTRHGRTKVRFQDFPGGQKRQCEVRSVDLRRQPAGMNPTPGPENKTRAPRGRHTADGQTRGRRYGADKKGTGPAGDVSFVPCDFFNCP